MNLSCDYLTIYKVNIPELAYSMSFFTQNNASKYSVSATYTSETSTVSILALMMDRN
jgi:hypothetical protein